MGMEPNVNHTEDEIANEDNAAEGLQPTGLNTKTNKEMESSAAHRYPERERSAPKRYLRSAQTCIQNDMPSLKMPMESDD